MAFQILNESCEIQYLMTLEVTSTGITRFNI